MSLRRPGDELGASVIVNGDSYGTIGGELEASLPIGSDLALGIGLNGGRTHFADGTRNWYHTETLVGRWRPARGIEIVPFWTAFTDVDDNSSPVYVPAGQFLPPQPRAGHYAGPWWNGINRTHFNYGAISSVALSESWLLRAGLFRSVRHLRNGYTYLFGELQPDGVGHRIMFVDPPVEQSRSERGVAADPHDRRGPAPAHAAFQPARPAGEARIWRRGRDRPRASHRCSRTSIRPGRRSSSANSRTIGCGSGFTASPMTAAGKASASSASAFRRRPTARRPQAPDRRLVARASPLLYNGTLTLLPLHGVAVYGGYSRGFEENGFPPTNAANRSDAFRRSSPGRSMAACGSILRQS